MIMEEEVTSGGLLFTGCVGEGVVRSDKALDQQVNQIAVLPDFFPVNLE